MNARPDASAAEGPADLDGAFQEALGIVNDAFPLTPLAVDPELAEPKSFLKILKARHMNWRAERFRKIFGMRFDVKIPSLTQMNLIMYPDAAHDMPVFLFFCLLTGRKIVCHVNLNCMRAGDEYRDRWTGPLLEARSRRGPFDTRDRQAEWLHKWRTPAGIYGMYPRERLGDILGCGLDYLRIYLEHAKQCAPVTDPAALREMAERQAQFVDDIRTQDRAQGMIAGMIGAEKARRIFYEVTT